MSRRSDNITAGPERMPNRSLLRACGMTDEEMNRPIHRRGFGIFRDHSGSYQSG